MLVRVSVRSVSAIAVMLFVSGCPTTTPPTPPLDTGPRDAAPRDTGVNDGGDVDADVDGAVPDGDVDGGGLDPGSCAFVAAEDLFELATDIADRPRTIGVASSPEGFAVAYASFAEGFQQIWLAKIPVSGAPGGAQQLTTDFAVSLEPAIAWTGESWLLSWFSNRDGGFEVYSRGYWPDGHMTGGVADGGRPTGPLQRLTNDAVRDDNPAMAALPDGSRLAWVTQAMDGTRTARTAALGPLGALVGSPVAVTAPGLVPSTPTLVERTGGYALAWGDPSSDAVLVPLDAAGAAGTPIVLSSEHTADGSVDLSLGDTGGLAVFGTLAGGIRPEIHAVPLDETAAIDGSERVLNIGTETGRDASVVALFGGYAVSYRALDTNMLRVVFLSLTLDEVARLDLVAAAADGGRTTIRASDDGSALLVGWADRVSATEIHIRAARIRCN
jgi:hypothetical protein